jgi:3-oxoacyl-[acyl-carrier-protein] synthase II
MERTRCVITGIGWVTPLGYDINSVWTRLLGGDSGVEATSLFDATTFPTKFSAEVRDFDLATFLGQAAAAHADGSRNTQFALAAAQMAWDGAGLANASLQRDRIGVYLGGGEGPLDFFSVARAGVASCLQEDGSSGEFDAGKWAQVAYQTFQSICEIEQDPHMAGSHLACLFDAQGPNFDTLTACAASTQAIGEACHWIRRGDVDVMISGGTHSMIHPLGVTGFNRLTALSTRNDHATSASRPFDRERDGFVLGEGAGIVILESLDHALARGADIWAEVVGYGSTADAFRVTDIHEDARGSSAAMRLALEDAGLTTADINYISAHGTGTKENDAIETKAIRHVFGDLAPQIPISSIKSMMGHLIAAAGGVELITCILAIRDGQIPPTINYRTPDPACDLDYVANAARSTPVNAALSNSFGFGGQNDTLIVKRYEP